MSLGSLEHMYHPCGRCEKGKNCLRLEKAKMLSHEVKVKEKEIKYAMEKVYEDLMLFSKHRLNMFKIRAR
jgi:hypothetical protein